MKKRSQDPFEIFSNLKILTETHPQYNYNTLSNYLSKKRIPYEDNDVWIERKIVRGESTPPRRIALVGKRVQKAHHDEERQNLQFWLSRPLSERLEAVTRLRAQVLKKGERMNKNYGRKRRMK